MKEMFESMSEGDSVLTKSGFYGVIIAIMDETVIVEFGNNRNCRIPMQKDAIAAVEKPNFEKAADEQQDQALFNITERFLVFDIKTQACYNED